MNEKIDFLRAVIRPAVTIEFSILTGLMFWTGREIPELLKYTWLAILAEYFGERLLFKLINNKGK